MNTTTKAGIPAAKTEEKYEYTTDQVEAYLNDQRFGALQGTLSRTECKIVTLNISPKFLPFLMLLPTSVIKGNGKEDRKQADELQMFNPDADDSSHVQLIQEIYYCVSPYTYNKQDENAFFSTDWRRERGVTSSMSSKLKYARTPRIQKFNKGRDKYVTVLIDPVRIFHDMMTNPNNPKEEFRADIGNIEKIREGQYMYTVYKNPITKKNKKNKNIDEIIAAEVTRRIRQ